MRNINNELSQFSGSESFTNYNHNIIITDGTKHLAENFNCFWLLDLICSYQIVEDFKENDFQVWTLKRQEGNKFIANCHDGDYNYLIEQEIPFSDFEGDEVSLWFTDNTILLPSEY